MNKIVFIFILFFVVNSAYAQDSLFNQINVQGTCTAKASPDQVSIIFQVVEEDKKTPEQAINSMNLKYNELLKQVKKIKLDPVVLRSSNYSVQEIKEWEKEKMVFKGYKAMLSLEVETKDLTKVPEILAVGQKLNLYNTSGLNYSLSEDKTQELKNQCYSKAVKQAKNKALALSEGLGVKLGKVLNITAETEEPLIQRPMVYALKSSGAANEMAPVDLEAGEKEVKVQARVIFELINLTEK